MECSYVGLQGGVEVSALWNALVQIPFGTINCLKLCIHVQLSILVLPCTELATHLAKIGSSSYVTSKGVIKQVWGMGGCFPIINAGRNARGLRQDCENTCFN